MLINHLNLLCPGAPFPALQPLLKIELLFIFLLICRSLLYILDKSSLWLYVLMYLLQMTFAFSLLVKRSKVLTLKRSNLSIFPIMANVLVFCFVCPEVMKIFSYVLL